jgi:hypothetical protein
MVVASLAGAMSTLQQSCPLHNSSFIKVAEDSILASIGISGCIREPETKSYARKRNSHSSMMSLPRQLEETLWKRLYERKTKSILRTVKCSACGSWA